MLTLWLLIFFCMCALALRQHFEDTTVCEWDFVCPHVMIVISSSTDHVAHTDPHLKSISGNEWEFSVISKYRCACPTSYGRLAVIQCRTRREATALLHSLSQVLQ
jgi:hypothetical protein